MKHIVIVLFTLLVLSSASRASAQDYEATGEWGMRISNATVGFGVETTTYDTHETNGVSFWLNRQEVGVYHRNPETGERNALTTFRQLLPEGGYAYGAQLDETYVFAKSQDGILDLGLAGFGGVGEYRNKTKVVMGGGLELAYNPIAGSLIFGAGYSNVQGVCAYGALHVKLKMGRR